MKVKHLKQFISISHNPSQVCESAIKWMEIINRQTSEAVEGPDEQGEICVKSPQCFKGYLNANNSQILDSDGFFHTGDLGYYDSQGVVYFIECIANLIQVIFLTMPFLKYCFNKIQAEIVKFNHSVL